MAVNYRLQDFTHVAGRDIMVDAMVLIYLFWPTGQHNFEQNYARVFRNLLRQQNNLYIDFLVISEIVNRVIKTEYEKHLLANSLTKDQLKYKDFRNSQDGQTALNDIYLILRNDILNHFNIIGKSFDKQAIESFLTVDALDFVDKATVSICTENGLVLLTNDKDFKNTGLDILTGNPHILN